MNKGIFKKAVAIVAGAAVFGGVSGGVFNLVVGDRVYNDTEISSEATSQDSSTEGLTTEVSTTNDAPAVVIPQSGGIINTSDGLGVTQIVEETMPSVVAITIKSIQEYDDWFFGQPYQYEAEGSGSGIIIGENDSELLIVTNNHVVEGADSVTVAFIDGEAYEAKVKGTDADNDVAVIEVNLSDLKKETQDAIKIAKIGDSDSLKVGEQVVAIGNALGYGQSVTTGIVSAKDRSNSTNQTPLIQTDAAINPGNSGGALINMSGEIVGINSSKYADTSVEGMGYAIPIKAVETIIGDLSEREIRDKVDADKVGYLGVETQTVDSNTSTYYGLPAGAFINNVTPDSPASKAGLKAKSVIVKFDGTTVSSAEALIEMLQYYEAGETVDVVCKVLEGEEYVDKTYSVTLAKRTDFIKDGNNQTTEETSTEENTEERPHGIFDEIPFDDMF